MKRNLPSAMTSAAVTGIALVAAAVITSSSAYAEADEIASFVSTRTRQEVAAELKTPYPGGNPWSGAYNMFQAHSDATSEQVQRDYIANRDRVNAFQGEDSGSVYIMKAQGSVEHGPTSVMGAPAR